MIKSTLTLWTRYFSALFLLAFVAVAAKVVAQNGYSFPHAASFGGGLESALAATSPVPSPTNQNPAATAFLSSVCIGFGAQLDYGLPDLIQNSVGIGIPFPRSSIGAGLTYLGDKQYSELGAEVVFAYRLDPNFAIGLGWNGLQRRHATARQFQSGIKLGFFMQKEELCAGFHFSAPLVWSAKKEAEVSAKAYAAVVGLSYQLSHQLAGHLAASYMLGSTAALKLGLSYQSPSGYFFYLGSSLKGGLAISAVSAATAGNQASIYPTNGSTSSSLVQIGFGKKINGKEDGRENGKGSADFAVLTAMQPQLGISVGLSVSWCLGSAKKEMTEGKQKGI